MKKNFYRLIVAIIASVMVLCACSPAQTSEPVVASPTIEAVENNSGVEIPDELWGVGIGSGTISTGGVIDITKFENLPSWERQEWINTVDPSITWKWVQQGKVIFEYTLKPGVCTRIGSTVAVEFSLERQGSYLAYDVYPCGGQLPAVTVEPMSTRQLQVGDPIQVEPLSSAEPHLEVPASVPESLRRLVTPQNASFFYEEGQFEYGHYKDPEFMGLWYENPETSPMGWYVLRFMNENEYILKWVQEADGAEDMVYHQKVFKKDDCTIFNGVGFFVTIIPTSENVFHYTIGPCS